MTLKIYNKSNKTKRWALENGHFQPLTSLIKKKKKQKDTVRYKNGDKTADIIVLEEQDAGYT